MDLLEDLENLQPRMHKAPRVRKVLTEQQTKDRIRKRGSYTVNVNTARKLKDFGVPLKAIYPVLLELHYLKRYTYGINATYAKESITQLRDDIEDKIIYL